MPCEARDDQDKAPGPWTQPSTREKLKALIVQCGLTKVEGLVEAGVSRSISWA
jgi:hypothetical protein